MSRVWCRDRYEAESARTTKWWCLSATCKSTAKLCGVINKKYVVQVAAELGLKSRPDGFGRPWVFDHESETSPDSPVSEVLGVQGKSSETGETGESTPDQIFTLEGDTPDDVDPDDDWIDFDEEV